MNEDPEGRLVESLTDEELAEIKEDVAQATDWMNAYLIEAALHEHYAHPPGSPPRSLVCLSQPQIHMIHDLLHGDNAFVAIAVMMDALNEGQKGAK